MRLFNADMSRASLACPSNVHAQVLQRKAKKARHSINGDPKLVFVDAPAVIGEELTMKLCGLADVIGDGLTALGAARNARFGGKIDTLAEDGGGWSLACAKSGEVSSITGDITWKFRCKSHNSLQFLKVSNPPTRNLWGQKSHNLWR